MNRPQEQDRDSCPLGVPPEMCINHEVTGWGCAECTRPSPGKDSTRDAC